MLLSIDRVSKAYGATRALVEVSTTFAGGEVHCLLGENGAGKSTLGKVIGGLVAPDSGAVSLDGALLHLTDARQARQVGIVVVHQELALAPDLSVRANLWLGSERGLASVISRANERERVAEVLTPLGLAVDPEQRTGDLLPAEQQLVEIGKALMAKPRLIVFDEPTSTLGAIEKRRLFEVIRRLRDGGVAVVLVTHHIEDVMEVADRVSVMRNGVLADSFLLGTLTADEVLERLTGRKRSAQAPAAQPSQSPPVLRIENLQKRDGTSIDLEIRAGEIVGFYGVLGCGAEKIVRGVAGEARTKIRFSLRGQPHRPSNVAHALSNGVAYLPAGRAHNAILARRSIYENLTVGRLGRFARLGVVQRSRERATVAEALARVRARFASMDDPISSLSGGNQQKVLLARVLVGRRDVLVLEEPTAGVDIEAKEQIHRLIREAADEGSAVLLLSSDLGEAVGLCHVIHAMYAGRLVASHVGPTSADQPDILFDVLGKRRADDLATSRPVNSAVKSA